MATISEALAIAIQHHQAGRLQAAEQIYRQILQLDPAHAEVYYLFGALCQSTGRLDNAVASLQQAVRLNPSRADAHNHLGVVLAQQGRLDEAIGCFRHALRLRPDFVDAQRNLGKAIVDSGSTVVVTNVPQAERLTSSSAEELNRLGITLAQQGKVDEAIAYFERAVQTKRDYPQAQHNLGIVLKAQGKLDEAVACFRQVVQLGFGGAAIDEGDRQQSVACYRPAAQAWPRNAELCNSLGEAFVQLATILRDRLPEEDLLAMRQLLSEPNLGDDGRAAVQFGLAEALDARGDYSAAAEHLREANAARLAAWKKRKQDYSPVEARSFITGVLATFTPQFFARASGFGLETNLPVFIIGLPRSGTTLVEQMLASHSCVFGAGELCYCKETFQGLPEAMNRNATPLQCLLDLDPRTTQDLAQRQLDRMRALDQRALRIVDKMPENLQYLGLIRVLFPQARLIHCHRDLRDVALSCWMTYSADVRWASDPDHIVSCFEEYARLVDHWRKVLPSPPLDVHYEEIVEDTEGVARRIVDWCGLEWEPGCLNFYETQRPVRTASAAQVRRPIYKSSVGRWKNYEKWLGKLFSRVHHLDEMWLDRQQATDRTN